VYHPAHSVKTLWAHGSFHCPTGFAGDYRGTADAASALGVLGAHQVSPVTPLALHLARAGDLESLEQTLVGFRLWHQNIPFFR
jgi:hypothetical protein